MDEFLHPSPGVDSDAPEIIELANSLTGDAKNGKDAASTLFRHVRDTYKYIPYAPFDRLEEYEGRALIRRGYGFCTHKSSLLVALARAIGIPARFHFADLKNHNLPGKLGEVLQSDLMIYHTYAELFLDNRWLKATPSFEKELCEKMGWRLVDFDGTRDATLALTDLAGRPHIEYLRDLGTRAFIPLEEMIAAWKKHYGEGIMERWNEASKTVQEWKTFRFA